MIASSGHFVSSFLNLSSIGCSYFVSKIRQSQRAVSSLFSADVAEDAVQKAGLTK